MRVYIMTDMEGVAGVLNFPDWTGPSGRYYELGKELLTAEVNAAIDGLFAGGATEIVVADGHGAGAITGVQLDPRVELMRGWPTRWPLLLDESYDAVAYVGQHAKAGTPFAHLAHTQSLGYRDLTINGVSVGEFGQFALCAGELGIPVIFGSGDRAFCAEAEVLVPGIVTVEVKRGTSPGSGNELDEEAYTRKNAAAIHMHPSVARARIRAGAEAAAHLYADGQRPMPPALEAPYELNVRLRPNDERGPMRAHNVSGAGVAAVMNMPYQLEEDGEA